MLDILMIIAPIAIVVATGFAVVRTGFASVEAMDGMMSVIFRLGFPCLVFEAISTLDLAKNFHPNLLLAYYIPAVVGFALGLFGARLFFNRPWPDAVVIGFAALFANGLLLGVPISMRAFGEETVGTNFAIISVHSAFTLTLATVAMQFAQSDGGSRGAVMRMVGKETLRNPLMIAIALAFAVNLTGVKLWGPLLDAIDMVAQAAIPAALLGLGGVLTHCEPKRAFGEALMVTAISLFLHPLMVLGMATGPFHVPMEMTRNAVMMAAMPTGMMAYAFSQIYGRATGAAASTVMFTTVGSALTAPLWIMVLNALPD